MTADDLFWARDVPKREERLPALVESTVPEPVPQRRYFDAGRFEQDCRRIVRDFFELQDAGVIPADRSFHDPALDVIRGHFESYADSEFDLDKLFDLLMRETDDMGENPAAAYVGCEFAKVGFLAAGLSVKASVFGSKARMHYRRLTAAPDALGAGPPQLPAGEGMDHVGEADGAEPVQPDEPAEA